MIVKEEKNRVIASAVSRDQTSFRDRSAKLLDRIVFCALLGIIILSVIPYGTVDQWWQSVFECAVFGVTALWVFEVLLRGSWQVRPLTVLVPVILLTGYAFLQTVN